MDLLATVSDDELPLLYAAALFDAPLSQGRMLELMQIRSQKTLMGNPYDVRLIRDLSLDLCKRQLLRQEIGLGYLLREDLRMTLWLRLQQSGELRQWIVHIRELLKKQGEYQHWKSYDAQFYQREMLFSVLLGRTDEALLWREKFFSVSQHHQLIPGMQFFRHEDGVTLFAQLRLIDQGMLLTDIFNRANWDLLDCRRAYDYACGQIAQQSNSWPQLMGLLAWQALLRGDFAQLEQMQRQLPPQAQGEILIALAVLQNKMQAAVGMAQTYAQMQKSASGRRKAFIPDLLGLFCTVAMLAKNDAASLKLAKAQVDEGAKQRYAYSYFVLQTLTNHLAQGVMLPVLHFAVRIPNDIDVLFEALAAYWQDAPPHPRLQPKLHEMRAAMLEMGYHWVAAELDVLLAQQFHADAVCPDWHRQHQIQPLVHALQREESWKRALTALTQLKPAGQEKQAQHEEELRLAWLLDMHFNELKLEPREQKRSAKGSWSKGRPVALRRLMQEPASMPYLTEQDRQLAGCVRKSGDSYFGGSEFDLNPDKAMLALIGHPAVYWSDAPDVRIDVLKGEMALQLKEKGDQITLQLAPYIAADAGMVWQKETPTRVLVYAATPEIRQITGILGRGLTVPATAKGQLVDVIAAIAPHLAIHSDLPELGAHLRTIPAATCFYAHLLPLQQGLRLQFLVRPLPEGGWLTPGKGAAHVLGEQDGKPVQASRDLARETTQLRRIVQACPALSEAEQQAGEWQIPHPEQCLELLAQLKAIPAEELELVWPEGERFRLKGSRSLTDLRLSIRRQGEWFVAGGGLTLDDGRVLALRELLQMAASARGRFLKIGEDDYLALTNSFRQRLEELRVLSEAAAKGELRLNALAAPALAELAAEAGELETDAAWREQLQKLEELENFHPQVPSTLQAELRDYQLAGYQWLSRLAHWGVGACLADDMGLGKTMQTLALLLQRAPAGPALVVAPVSVAMNWQAEALRFAPTLSVRLYQSQRSLEALGAFDLVIVSYGMLQSDARLFAAQHWHSIVLDEAQVIKNAATKRSQAAMALQADFKMIASGTPVENHLGELWNLFRFINPGLLGSRERFAERFSTPIERGDSQARQHLKKLIQPFILRRTKAQVLTELPPRTEITLQVELSDEERHLYEALRQEAMDSIAAMSQQEGQSLKVLAEITKLRRFCCHPQLVFRQSAIHGSKLAVLHDTITELLDNRHKALVFSQFVDHLAIVRASLDSQGIAYQYLDGSIPAAERKKRVDAFQAGEGDIFLISLKAGGTGLNLTAADYVIHLDPWWNPAVEDQASDRAHRMGQQRPVTIYRLVTQNTIEEKILALHAEKRDLADSLLDEGDVAARLDTAALLNLLKTGV